MVLNKFLYKYSLEKEYMCTWLLAGNPWGLSGEVWGWGIIHVLTVLPTWLLAGNPWGLSGEVWGWGIASAALSCWLRYARPLYGQFYLLQSQTCKIQYTFLNPFNVGARCIESTLFFQTVQTQIRGLLYEPSDQGLDYLKMEIVFCSIAPNNC